MTDQIIRIRKVIDTVGLTRSSIYRQMDAGTFPKPLQLGPRCVGWRQSEIERWISERMPANNNK